MSSRKNKNKNRPHRPPISISSLETNVNPIKDTSSEDVKKDVKSESDFKEERVPEIQSEVVTTVNTNITELVDDAPKKPKRNKDKKRKEEKTENIEKSLLTQESKVKDDKSFTEYQNDVSLEINIQKSENETGITPVARKKKNKNKKRCESPINELKSEEKLTDFLINLETNIEIESDITKDDHSLIIHNEFMEQEVKPKKKNKRKKDQSDFNKIALLEHENKNKCEVTNIDSNILVSQDYSTSVIVSKEANIMPQTSLDIKIIDHNLQKQENLLNQETGEQDKVKNKKPDESPKTVGELNTTDVINIETFTKNEEKTSLTIKKTDKEIQKKQRTTETVTIENTDLQGELKRTKLFKKGEIKKDVQNLILDETDTKTIHKSERDNTKEKSSERKPDDGQIPIQEEKQQKQKVKKEKKLPSMEITKSKKSDVAKDKQNAHRKDILSQPDKEPSNANNYNNPILQDIDNLKNIECLPETSASNFTVDETKDNASQSLEETANKDLQVAKETECKIVDQQIVKTKAKIVKPVERKLIDNTNTEILIQETRLENVVSEKEFLPLLNIETVADAEILGASKTTFFPEGTECLVLPNLNSAKQSNISFDHKIDSDLGNTSSLSNTSQDDVIKSTHIPIAVSLEILEESNFKTEDATGSPSDILPHIIECIRATSEQLLDDNNNTVIQEVITPEEILTTSCEIIPNSSGTQCLENPKNVKEESKTDLKSKVIEVSQDLEGLRLSIEKSLAELNILDKHEEPVVEKPYTEKEKIATLENIQIDEKIGSTEVEKPSVVSCDNLAELPKCPSRKDHKGKNKSKKKNKQENFLNVSKVGNPISNTESKQSTSNEKKEDKTEQKTDESKEKGKQQCIVNKEDKISSEQIDNEEVQGNTLGDYDPIEKFEDAMSSSIDYISDNFETNASETEKLNGSEINSFFSVKDDQKKSNSVVQPKNLLGHPDIPVQSNKTDYKKEKNKLPNNEQAKVNIKDSEQIESNCKTNKQSKESQTFDKRISFNNKATHQAISSVNNGDEEYIYKYSFRKVFLPSACHVCKKELKQARFTCDVCNLVQYCSTKHKEEDIAQHRALCFAVSTIMHLKEQKHIYAEAKNIVGHNYRLLRMQMIVSCEKILKRKLVPWEQEALLYPRMCADFTCREWRQAKLKDCDGCGQISFCSDQPDHVPKIHHRWCKSFALYQKLVCYQQTKGRLEPKLPSRVITEKTKISDKINEVLAFMYLEKIDLNDMQYATLTQLGTAPLTTAYCHQLCSDTVSEKISKDVQKCSFTVHVVGAELQFEADVLNKWEVFFLHLRPDVQKLTVVLVSQELNPSNLPLDLLGKIRLCEICRQSNRKVVFDFQDKQNYFDYFSSDNYVAPDIVCAFNSSIQRTSIYNGKDPWSSSIKCILKSKVPFVVTSYTMEELRRDAARIQECADAEYTVVSGPKHNGFASVRPDRNFISDDEMPLLFKNYCFMVVCGN